MALKSHDARVVDANQATRGVMDIQPELIKSDPVFRAMRAGWTQEFSRRMHELFDGAKASDPLDQGVNGFRYDSQTKRVVHSNGPNEMELRNVRFLRVPKDGLDPRLLDKVNFPFVIDGDSVVVPFYGQFHIGGEVVGDDKLGIDVVSTPGGKPVTIDVPAYEFGRGVVIPGEYKYVVARGHEVAKPRDEGDSESIILYDRFTPVEGPAMLESHVMRFEPETAERTLEQLNLEAGSRMEDEWRELSSAQSLGEYAKENFTRHYTLRLGEYLEDTTGTAQVWDACGLYVGGTGSNYYGHFQFMPDGVSETEGDFHMVTKTGKDPGCSFLGDKAAFVGVKSLVEADAKGGFLDEGHQPWSGVPIGLCGIEENSETNFDRQTRLMRAGVVPEKIFLGSARLVSKQTVDKACAPLSMCTQNHPLVGESPEKQGAYATFKLIMGDTRKLYEIMQKRLPYIEYVITEYSDGEQRDNGLELIRRIKVTGREKGSGGKEADGKGETPDVSTALVKYTGSNSDDLKDASPGLSGGESLLLMLMYHHARDQHLAELSRNMGRSLRAVMQCDLTTGLGIHSAMKQNFGVKGSLGDLADLADVTIGPEDVMDRVAAGARTYGDFMRANDLMMALPGVSPEQNPVYQVFIRDLFATIETSGMDPVTYLNTPHFKQFLANFLGGHEAGSYYHNVAQEIYDDFVLHPPRDSMDARLKFGKAIHAAFKGYDSQQRSRTSMHVYDAIRSSPFAQETRTVHQSESHTLSGMDCFKAADGKYMVTPNLFANHLDMLLLEMGSLVGGHRFGEEEQYYSESAARTQSRVLATLDEVIEGLSRRPDSPIDLVGWQEKYFLRHLTGNVHAHIAWDHPKQQPEFEKDASVKEGEQIHVLSPREVSESDGRDDFILTSWMQDALSGDTPEARDLSPDDKEWYSAREIMSDLRDTIGATDWSHLSDMQIYGDGIDSVGYAYLKLSAFRALFDFSYLAPREPDSVLSLLTVGSQETPANDYQFGMTQYLLTRVAKKPEHPDGKPKRRKLRDNIRFDWLDE